MSVNIHNNKNDNNNYNNYYNNNYKNYDNNRPNNIKSHLFLMMLREMEIKIILINVNNPAITFRTIIKCI